MKHIIPIVMALMLPCASISAQNTRSIQDAIRYIIMKDGQVVAIPEKHILSEQENNGTCILTLEGDTTFTYGRNNVSQVTNTYIPSKAEVLSFSFTHDANDQVYKDVTATVTEKDDSIFINAEVPVIGKRLRPSFTLTDGATLWVGDKQQVSGQSSQRFTEPINYTLAQPKHWIYDYQLIINEPENQDKWSLNQIDIADKASTNAPSNYGEDISNLWDNNTYTFYHSTWGTGAYQKLNWVEGGTWGDGITEWPYIEIELPEDMSALCFEYTTSDQNNRFPLGWNVTAKNSETGKWENLGTLSQMEDNLPTTTLTEYQSPVYDFGEKHYTAVRIELTKASHKNYMVLSELKAYSCIPQELEANETVIKGFKPFGRPCQVSVKYLTDYSTGEYQVPAIYLTFGDGTTWNSTQWIGQTLSDGTNTKENWIDNCTFRLDGAGIWPDIDTVEGCQIRGRGNSSWSWTYASKNPYRIKFPKKQKQSPFNLIKDRQWVFISNKQSGSMTTNAIAQKIAAMVDAEALCHMIPVEMYINGHYRGSYCFTEKIKISDNSVAVDETKGALLELDDYYDEDFKFNDNTYILPVNVKDPDFTEEDPDRVVTFTDIQNSFNSLTATLKAGGNIAGYLDMESWAKFWLVNDLVRNVETYHPKSCYLFNPDLTNQDERSLWKMGPAWDFDWAFGYEETKDYFIYGADMDIYSAITSYKAGALFYDAIRNSKAGKRAYYKEWLNFMAEDRLQELTEYIDDYTEFVLPSIQHNNDASILEKDKHDYQVLAEKSKQWLKTRANYIFNNLEKFDMEPDVVSPEDYGQPNNIEDAAADTEDINRPVDVYTIGGILLRRQVPYLQSTNGLAPGMYVIGGKTVIIR